MSDGYQKALEAAGAEILQFKEFGSYQGEWWALVLYVGNKGWVNGSYGSCSGCDSFEAEFGYFDHEGEDNKSHDWEDLVKGCEECEKILKKLADFGKPYLNGMFNQERAEKEAAEDIEWDEDAKDMLAFVKENKIN